MNIYFICPKDFEPSNFHIILELLKVKVVLNLIPSNAGINPEAYVDEEMFEDICYEDLSYIPSKPKYRYISKLAREICNYILPNGYMDILGYIDEESDIPYKQSNAKDFIANLIDLDDPNILVLFNTPITDVVKNIYKEWFRFYKSRELEDRIPILCISSWTTNPERNIVRVLRKLTKEERQELTLAFDNRTHTYRDIKPTEKYGFKFCDLDIEDIKGKYCYGAHGDPFCYLYKQYVHSFDDDDFKIKLEMSRQLFTKEAQHKMNEKLEEMAEERREMEYQEWLHADEIEDRDYERETYEALGGDDYD